jgi:Protein of unknown function (DUF4236)
MDVEVQKRIRVAPGMRINLSKRGITSVSVGPKGGTTTISRRGIRNNFSIKGTGFSWYKEHRWNQPQQTLETTNEASPRDDKRALFLVLVVPAVLLAAVGGAIVYGGSQTTTNQRYVADTIPAYSEKAYAVASGAISIS